MKLSAVLPLLMTASAVFISSRICSCESEWTVTARAAVLRAVRAAERLGLQYKGQVKGLRRVLRFQSTRGEHTNTGIGGSLARHAAIRWMQKEIPLIREKRSETNDLEFNDPGWRGQWYLKDRQELARGTDNISLVSMGIEKLMIAGLTGKGVRVIIVDDGLDYTNTDLRNAYDFDLGYDVNDEDWDPLPRPDFRFNNRHGTQCAGVVAMQPNNHFCGVGIAPNIRLGGVRLLDGPISDRTEAEAFGVFQSEADIFSSSWGPSDNGKTAASPGVLLGRVLRNGIKKGRGGMGSVYVWASGNGGRYGDHCGYDGYATSMYTISMGSVDEDGLVPVYGEACAAIHGVVYTRGRQNHVVTTSLNNRCSSQFSGTSAAAPIVAGILALILQLRPSLTWLEIQHLLIYTCRPGPVKVNGPWVTNSAGLHYSEKVGFGLLDAEAMMKEVQRWSNLSSPRMHHTIYNSSVSSPISSTDQLTLDFLYTGGQESRIKHLEHVQVFLDAEYTRRGALSVMLESARGTQVRILGERPLDDAKELRAFTVTSLASWGEDPAGTWKVIFRGTTSDKKNRGRVKRIFLVISGTERATHRMTARFKNEQLNRRPEH